MNHGYVGEMYQKYGRVVSPMGCRAYLSPFWEKSQDVHPLDETDKPVFVGRWNGGAISLNTPMIYLKAQRENKDFFEELEYYLQMARSIHIRTYKYLSRQRASVNPLAYTQGGFYNGFLKPDDYIEPLLKYVTFSYGYTALNELQEAYNGKSLYEDGDFAYKTLQYINEFAERYKPVDHIMYAVYGTPAESLATLQAKQCKQEFGIIPNVDDKEYVSNSFHCAVWEKITPAQKQDAEYRFFHISNGGHIQYCRYPNGNNKEAIKAMVSRGMQKGFYEGVNIEKNYCEECGTQFYEGDECPHCHSKNISQVNRVCGYLGWSKVGGDTRMNKGKLAEIKDRVSM